MSLPAAAAPVAILVLAWDEAIPAVRALVEATNIAAPLLDSVLVLVPAGPADEEELLQEEFLPIAPLPEPPAALPPPVAAAPLVVPAPAEASPLPPAPGLPAPPLAERAASAERLEVATAAPPRIAPEAAVRVLHLSSFSLPALAALAGQALPLPIWSGKAALPAAPYVGSGEIITTTESFLSQNQLPDSQSSDNSKPISLSATTPPLPLPSAAGPPVLAAASAPLGHLPGELLALGAEADLPLAPEFAAVRASWPQALASLREPLALEEAEPADVEDEAAYYAGVAGAQEGYQAPLVPLALRPASQEFGAPNLNFQVIQYARFAVPVALAQDAFAAIYAPAWPTWLAAQELRYRTGRPLVLHVSTLAAGAGESVETATSWQAELQRQALHRADLILTETPALARRLRQDLALPPELVRAVPAADAAAIAQALHGAQTRPTTSAS